MSVFVARQPIFNAKHKVLGYELLYRQDNEAEGSDEDDGTTSLVVDSMLGFGLGNVTDGETAFLHVTRNMLLGDVVDAFEPSKVVIELLESVRPDPEVIAACCSLKEKGFGLALDDFSYVAEYDPLLALTDVVKLDVVAHANGSLQQAAERMKRFDVKLLAEKVESQEVHQECVALGFEMFQGFHYFRPENLSKQDLSTDSIAIVRLLNLLQDINATDSAVKEAFRSDPGLSYKLLRMVNSAALGGRGIDSVEHALRLLGRDPLSRWLSMLLVSSQGKTGYIRGEVVKSALLRGRLCELLGENVKSAGVTLPKPEALFLAGLFSHLETLFGRSMEEIPRPSGPHGGYPSRVAREKGPCRRDSQSGRGVRGRRLGGSRTRGVESRRRSQLAFDPLLGRRHLGGKPHGHPEPGIGRGPHSSTVLAISTRSKGF